MEHFLSTDKGCFCWRQRARWETRFQNREHADGTPELLNFLVMIKIISILIDYLWYKFNTNIKYILNKKTYINFREIILELFL